MAGSNSNFTGFPRSAIEQSITARFENIVSIFGDNIAVSVSKKQITYSELNRRSNRIGNYLSNSEVSRRQPVAVLLDNGISLLATIIGILKSGHIYTPLDPAGDIQELTSIRQDAGAGLILTDTKHLTSARRIAERECLVTSVESIDTNSLVPNLGVSISADDPAYIYYISGSTARSKGVKDSHRASCTIFCSIQTI